MNKNSLISKLVALPLVAAGSLLATSFALADTITFQQGVSPTASYAGTQDAVIRPDSPDTNNSAGNNTVGRTTGTTVLRDTISFDLSSIPSGATINSISFSLVVDATDSGSTSTTVTLELRQLTQSFIENQVTWNSRSTGNPWSTPGGSLGASQLSALSLNPLTASGTQTFASSAAFVSAAQSAYNNSTPLYFALKLDSAGESLSTREIFQFRSKEFATASSRPLLSVDYTVSAVPEPSSYALAAGGMGLLVCFQRLRRRRVGL